MKISSIPLPTILSVISTAWFNGCGQTPLPPQYDTVPPRQTVPIHRTEEVKEANRTDTLPPTKAPTSFKPKPKPVKVEDDNFDPSYMYLENEKKTTHNANVTPPQNLPPAPAAKTMSKDACIALIGEAKFTRYTEMLGSEAAALKRCAMLKAMQER